MSKLTREERNAILSARAKNRKAAIALGNAGVKLPKSVVNKMRQLDEYFTAQVTTAKAASGPVQDQEAAVADEVIAA
jgi:hypothetical protein